MGDPKKYRDATPREMYEAIFGGAQLQARIEKAEKDYKEQKHGLKFSLMRDPIRESRFILLTMTH